jgi:quaternary ammonium compound-resistance protein SugE
MIASFYFLSLALKSLPLGTAYAIWTGIGTVGTVALGIILFKEPVDIIRLICIGFIVIGIVGLKIVSSH